MDVRKTKRQKYCHKAVKSVMLSLLVCYHSFINWETGQFWRDKTRGHLLLTELYFHETKVDGHIVLKVILRPNGALG